MSLSKKNLVEAVKMELYSHGSQFFIKKQLKQVVPSHGVCVGAHHHLLAPTPPPTQVIKKNSLMEAVDIEIMTKGSQFYLQNTVVMGNMVPLANPPQNAFPVVYVPNELFPLPCSCDFSCMTGVAFERSALMPLKMMIELPMKCGCDLSCIRSNKLVKPMVTSVLCFSCAECISAEKEDSVMTYEDPDAFNQQEWDLFHTSS